MRVAQIAVVASLISTALCLLPSQVMAQVTTSNVRGTVRGEDGAAMAGVEVTLVDESNGSIKSATTNGNGEFAFTNLQVGGPYHVTSEVPGFKASEEKGIFLSANKTRDVVLVMRLQEEVIEVSGTSITRNTSNRTVISATEIDELPSVGRDPRDLIRRNPEVSVEGGARTLSVGGANNRYNSITVDGVRQDDDFGLNASGYPTRRSPISMSALEEITVDSSPFDVHYGKFLGGNVNIITKSGTNEFKGQLLGTYTSDALLGNRSRSTKRINVDYQDLRYGATVSGPIIKDKLHFLASIEGLRSTTPIDNGPMDSNAAIKVPGVTNDQVAEAQRIAREVYGFDAGVASQTGKETDLKLLGKLDWTINKQHRASVSYQRTAGNNIQVGNAASTTVLPLSSNWYNAQDTLNTFSGRVFSDWSDQLSTTVEANAKLVSSRVPPLNGNDFMAVQINTLGTTNSIRLGPDPFRHANLLDNDVFHTKAEANYLLGTNLLTGGIEYELTRIRNLFVPNSNGTVVYADLAHFEAMQPISIQYQNSITLNPLDAAANWNVGVWTGYLQDQVKLTPELTLQGGARLEVYQTASRSQLNPIFSGRYGFGNNASLDGRTSVLPRLGLSWLPMDNLNVRAGAGLYSGGTPAVWVSNNYTNDGVRTFQLTSKDPNVINGFDGRHIPQALQDAVINGAGNGNVDALDPNFKIPSVWKIGTGADYSFDVPALGDLGKKIEVKGNYTFTKVRSGVTWKDLRRNSPDFPNNTPVGSTVDGRPMYSEAFNATRGYDMLLTNDDRGYAHVASVVVQKAFESGLFLSGSYAYTDNQEVNPGTSSVSTSNYGIVAVVDPDHPDLAVSNYERRHRFTGTFEYSHELVGEFTDASPWKHMKTTFGMFIESRSGQPYSWTFAGATLGAIPNQTSGADNQAKIFGEETTMASRGRELFYVPQNDRTCETPGGRDKCDVILQGMSKDDFNTFLDRTGLAKYRGKISPRNAFTGPRQNRIDFRFAQDLPNPLSGHRARFVFDFENLGNAIGGFFNQYDWGSARSVSFPYYVQAVNVTVDRATGVYTYSPTLPTGLRSPNPTTSPGGADLLQPLWRISLGLMYDF
jgi:outer membrane receptor for ferrienterochelin and colicin